MSIDSIKKTQKNQSQFSKEQQTHIVRAPHDKEHPYFLVQRDLMRSKLSLKAKGLMGYLLSLIDKWFIHPKQLAIAVHCGKDAIYSILKELIDFGYCKLEILRDKGKFLSATYFISEAPMFMSDKSTTDESFDDIPNLPLDDFPPNQPHPENQEMAHKNCEPFPGNPDPEKPDIKEYIDISLDNDISIKDVMCVSPTPSSSNNLKKIKRRENVETSNEDHEQLVSELGQLFTEQVYDHLSNWKFNSPKRSRKSDIFHIRDWIILKVREINVKTAEIIQREQRLKQQNNTKIQEFSLENQILTDTEIQMTKILETKRQQYAG